MATGIEDITAKFAAAGLGAPPVPSGLATALIRRDEWFWSTRELDRGGLYDPPDLIDDALGDGPDYLAVGTSGHGVNSYFLTCRAVVGPVALFVQAGWGGIYMDEAQQAAEITGLFQGAIELLERAEGLPNDGRRLLVAVSLAKQWNLCQWVRADGRTWQDLAIPERDFPTEALAVAMASLHDDPMPTLPNEVAATVNLRWEDGGRVHETELGPWVAGLPKAPALYRFRFLDRGGPWVYVGETMNLARRMAHYRTGDPRLATNAWVHALITEHLVGRKAIELDVAFKASVTVAGLTRELSLHDKLDRVLAEAAAIHTVPRDALLNKH